MHEMAIAENILGIIDQELKKHGCTKLTLVRVRYGALAQVVPDSLLFCFEAVLKGGPYEGAVLELEEVPLVLLCGQCQQSFTPPQNDSLAPCSNCGSFIGHSVEQGQELFVQHIEAE